MSPLRRPDVRGQAVALTERASASLADLTGDVRERMVLAADARRAGFLSSAMRTALRVPNPLPSYWWTGGHNFGDVLAPVLLAHVSGLSPQLAHSRRSGKVVGLGSVLWAARPGDTVWGTGAQVDRPVDLAGTTILAVRGPRTARLIRGDVPAVYGDPAIMLPHLHQPRPLPRSEVGLIPHVVDRSVMTTSDPSVRTIDLATSDWRAVIDLICSCDVVLSSSLHGVIAAEAYGVPAVWIKASENVVGDGFKFFDYYESTGRLVEGPRQWGEPVLDLVASATTPPVLDPLPLMDAWRRHDHCVDAG